MSQDDSEEEWGDDPWEEGDWEENIDDEDGVESISLDDLGAAYARAAAAHDPESFAEPSTDEPESDEATEEDAAAEEVPPTTESEQVHPAGIIEAALFIGHPENECFTAKKLAGLMRDVSADEVVALIKDLNQTYKDAEQAFRIVEQDEGFRLTIAPQVEEIRSSFLGKVREARLTQSAIEVLALVAYQPGITAQTVQDQRGRDCGALLNQLVRRRLLEIERKPAEKSGKRVAHYSPTERFLALFHLESLEDLPMVDEGPV